MTAVLSSTGSVSATVSFAPAVENGALPLFTIAPLPQAPNTPTISDRALAAVTVDKSKSPATGALPLSAAQAGNAQTRSAQTRSAQPELLSLVGMLDRAELVGIAQPCPTAPAPITVPATASGKLKLPGGRDLQKGTRPSSKGTAEPVALGSGATDTPPYPIGPQTLAEADPNSANMTNPPTTAGGLAADCVHQCANVPVSSMFAGEESPRLSPSATDLPIQRGAPLVPATLFTPWAVPHAPIEIAAPPASTVHSIDALQALAPSTSVDAVRTSAEAASPDQSLQAAGFSLLATPANQPETVSRAAGETASLIQRHLDVTQGTAWIDDLARDIAAMSSSDGQLRFGLVPERLGRIDVDIRHTNTTLNVHFTTQTEPAQAILAAARTDLQATLGTQSGKAIATTVTSQGQDRPSGQPSRKDIFTQIDARPIEVGRVFTRARRIRDGRYA